MELNEYVVFNGNFREALEEAQKREIRLASLSETGKIISSGRDDLLRTGTFLGTGTIAICPRIYQQICDIEPGEIKFDDFIGASSPDSLLIEPNQYRTRIDDSGTINLSPFPREENRIIKKWMNWVGLRRDLRFGVCDDKILYHLEFKLIPGDEEKSYVGPLITGGFDMEHAITAFPPMGRYTYLLVPPSLEESLQESAVNNGLNLITLKCTQQKYADALHNARLYAKNFLGNRETKTAFETLIELLDAQKPIIAEGYVIIKSALPFDQFNRCVTEAVRSTSGKGELLYEQFFKILLRASQQLPLSQK